MCVELFFLIKINFLRHSSLRSVVLTISGCDESGRRTKNYSFCSEMAAPVSSPTGRKTLAAAQQQQKAESRTEDNDENSLRMRNWLLILVPAGCSLLSPAEKCETPRSGRRPVVSIVAVKSKVGGVRFHCFESYFGLWAWAVDDPPTSIMRPSDFCEIECGLRTRAPCS